MESQTIPKSHSILLSTAKSLFWKHGIRRVKVSEICREAGVSKMTFYRNFKNKNDLAEQMVEGIIQQSMGEYQAMMQSDRPFPEKVRGIVALKHKWSKGISKEFVMDLMQMEDKHIAMKFETYRQKQLQNLMADLAKAQAEGWIRAEVSLDFLLYTLNDMSAKMMDPQLNSLYENEEDLIMELTNFFFYGVLAPSPPAT
jgi:AcrR family transcriptional regulator